jgi:hypothetical protein
MAQIYSKEFYLRRQKLTRQSVQKIIGILYPLLRPQSVIDLGCATGTWLAECTRQGANEILGIDGEWVDKNLLEIDGKDFVEHNLGQEKFKITHKYDLAICVEVAEHLSEDMGEKLIDSLCEASDVILFSAAVKGQGGTGHINEQPQHYWATHFKTRGYTCLDLVRPEVWCDESINVIYKQNMLVYMQESLCDRLGFVRREIATRYDLDRIHPDLFLKRSRAKIMAPGVKACMKMLMNRVLMRKVGAKK